MLRLQELVKVCRQIVPYLVDRSPATDMEIKLAPYADTFSWQN